MHSIMSFVGRKTHDLINAHGIEWQEGYYETRIRTPKQSEYVRRYIETNPVAKKLVIEPSDWDATSANMNLLGNRGTEAAPTLKQRK
jgi:hypothetical protein